MTDEMKDPEQEDRPNEAGAEGGESEDKESLPGGPGADESEAGDTDQHSSSDA